MPQGKPIKVMFHDIGIEKPSDQNTIKTQIIEYLTLACGTRQQASDLKQKGLSNLIDQFLETPPGRHHFPRRRGSNEWNHYCTRDEVMATLAKITMKWLPGLKKEANRKTRRTAKSSKQKSRISKASMPPRMTMIEIEEDQAHEPPDEESGELLDLDEIFAKPSDSTMRDTREETIRAESVVPVVDTQVQPTRHAPSAIVPVSSKSIFQAINSPSTSALVSGHSGTKRKHRESTMANQEREEETEDSSDEEDQDELAEQASKRTRLDRDPTSSQHPTTSRIINNRETSTEYVDAQQRLPSPASHIAAENTEQTSVPSYNITIPADLFTHSTSQSLASFWPNLITSMIRDRQHAARTRLATERSTNRNVPCSPEDEEDSRIIDTVSRVLQDLHDDFEVIKMVAEGRREEYEDTVGRRRYEHDLHEKE